MSRKHNPARFELPPTAGLPLCFRDFTGRPDTDFSSAMQSWLGIPKPVMTCSGTAALVLSLSVLHKASPERNKVIVPAYTCPLVPLAVSLLPGLKAVTCDTKPGHFDFDSGYLEAMCDKHTLAVIPAHLGGRVGDMKQVCSIASAYGVPVVEDAAQALGARHFGKSVGLSGDIGFFSLAAGKGLSIYEGGMLFSRDPSLHDELRREAEKLLKPSLFWTLRRNIELFGYAFFYHPERFWWVYGRSLRKQLAAGNEIEAIGDFFTDDIPMHSLDAFRLHVAGNTARRLPEFLEQGRERAARRLALLRDVPGAVVLEDSVEGAEGVWPFFMVLMPEKSMRDKALRTLWQSGLGVTKLFVHSLGEYVFLKAKLEHHEDCPNARDFSERMLTISNSHWLSDEHFSYIVEELKQAVS